MWTKLECRPKEDCVKSCTLLCELNVDNPDCDLETLMDGKLSFETWLSELVEVRIDGEETEAESKFDAWVVSNKLFEVDLTNWDDEDDEVDEDKEDE